MFHKKALYIWYWKKYLIYIHIFILLYLGSEKFPINKSPAIKDDSTNYQEEPRDMPDYVEADYPGKNKEDSDSDDYIEDLLKEIWDQNNYNKEPSEEIIPKVNSEWQGNTYSFFLIYIISSIAIIFFD